MNVGTTLPRKGQGVASGIQQLPADPSRDIPELYLKIERVILPLFYAMPYAYATVMRNAIAVNGSWFNTQRMVMQYAQNAYGVAPVREAVAV